MFTYQLNATVANPHLRLIHYSTAQHTCSLNKKKQNNASKEKIKIKITQKKKQNKFET